MIPKKKVIENQVKIHKNYKSKQQLINCRIKAGLKKRFVFFSVQTVYYAKDNRWCLQLKIPVEEEAKNFYVIVTTNTDIRENFNIGQGGSGRQNRIKLDQYDLHELTIEFPESHVNDTGIWSVRTYQYFGSEFGYGDYYTVRNDVFDLHVREVLKTVIFTGELREGLSLPYLSEVSHKGAFQCMNESNFYLQSLSRIQ